MRRRMRRAAGVVLALAATALLGALSRVPYTASPDGLAVLRLSWRTLGERVEECRRLTPEELAALPVHMRREEVCEGRVAAYRLAVEVDGRPVLERVVRPSGARADRPIYVFEEFRLAPGVHRARVAFRRADAAPSDTVLSLVEEFGLASGEIALVTLDDGRGRLVLRRPPSPPRSGTPGSAGEDVRGEEEEEER